MPDDLRQEVMERLRDAETRRRIADALIMEATGGAPDPKSGVPKGGATVIRAFELIREIALERAPVADAADCDLSRYADAELSAMLASLEGDAMPAAPGDAMPTSPAAAAPGDWASGIPPPVARRRGGSPPDGYG